MDNINDVCYADSSDIPSNPLSAKSTDVTARFTNILKFGFILHIIGVFADFGFLLQIKHITNKTYKLCSIILMAIYTTGFLIWLIWLFVLRFRHIGLVCAGHYLTEGANP